MGLTDLIRSTIFKPVIKTTARIGFYIGTTIVAVSAAGCAPEIFSDTTGLPSLNPTMGRTYDMWEGDIQAQPDKKLSTTFSVPCKEDVVGANVYVKSQEGRDTPFKAEFRGVSNSDGREVKVTADMTDTDASYFEGETLDLHLTGISRKTGRSIDEVVHVAYHGGISGTTAQQQINTLREDVTELTNDLEDHENTPIDQTHQGGNQNPPPVTPPTQPTIPTINNMKNLISMQIYEGPNQLPDADYNNLIPFFEGTTRNLTARLIMPSDLEAQLFKDGFGIPTAEVIEIGYGPGTSSYNPFVEPDGIFTGAVQPAVRVAPGVYDTAFGLRNETFSLQHQAVVDAAVKLTDPSGTYEFSDAAFFSE